MKLPEDPDPQTAGNEPIINTILQMIEDAWYMGASPARGLLSTPGPSSEGNLGKKWISPDQEGRLMRLLDELIATQHFARSISQGDLAQNLKARGTVVGSLKALQSSLRHLTWQTKMIASGDFSQRVEFMGEFSQAFNEMVVSLGRARLQLERQAQDLATANERLLAEIGERIQVEQDLIKSQERFHIALDNAPITVSSQDRDLRYTWIHNPPFDITPEEMIGRRDDELFPPEEVTELVELKRSVVESGIGARREIHLTLHGKSWVFDITVEPLRDADRNIIGLTAAAVDETEQRRMEREIFESISRLEVQHHLIQQREMERLKIARDLHDGPLQELIAISFELQAAQTAQENEDILLTIASVRESIDHLIHELRSFAGELRPPVLTKFGLISAIRAFTATVQEKHPGLGFHLDLNGDGNHLPEQVLTAIYRIYQEGLNNIIRHASANQVWVKFHQGNHQVRLEVRDDGVGFTLPDQWVMLARAGHLGLVGMIERVDAIGGQIQVVSSPGEGTTLEVTVQVDPVQV